MRLLIILTTTATIFFMLQVWLPKEKERSKSTLCAITRVYIDDRLSFEGCCWDCDVVLPYGVSGKGGRSILMPGFGGGNYSFIADTTGEEVRVVTTPIVKQAKKDRKATK